MSMTWWYWRRISPLALMPFGQCITIPAMFPPPWANVIPHVHGVEPAIAQPTA